MADDLQKRSVLDQITSAATAPQPVPSVLAPPVGVETSLADAPATTEGSIDNLESRASSPDTLASDSEATKSENAKSGGFLSKLKDFAGGALGLENPRSSSAAGAGAKTRSLIGSVGNALALAGGTPEEKQIAEENVQTPLKLAQIENEREYREGVIGAKNNANDINQQKADQQQIVANGRMRLKGYVPDEKTPGAYRSMNEDEILTDPVLSKNQALTSAATASKNAGAALSAARYDAMMNPDNPTMQLKARQIENTYKLAQAHLALQLHTQGRQDQQFLYDWGQTPGVSPTSAGEGSQPSVAGSPGSLNLNNAPDMMMVDPRTGMPIPQKMLSTLKPTQQEQNRADFAASAIHTADILSKMYQDASAKIGPFSGRISELMAKAGVGDQFNQELQNYVRFVQSAATAAHTGRFSVPILEKMDKMIGPQMGADQFGGALDSIKTQMSPYADAGWKPTVKEYRDALASGAPLNSPGGNKVSPTPNKKVPSFKEFMQQQKAGGK